MEDLELGMDITDEVLNDENYTFLLIAYDLNKYHLKNQYKINLIAEHCLLEDYNFICLTSSLPEKIEEFRNNKTDQIPITN